MDREVADAIRHAGFAIGEGLTRLGKEIGEAIKLYAAVKARSVPVRPDDAKAWVQEVKKRSRSSDSLPPGI